MSIYRSIELLANTKSAQRLLQNGNVASPAHDFAFVHTPFIVAYVTQPARRLWPASHSVFMSARYTADFRIAQTDSLCSALRVTTVTIDWPEQSRSTLFLRLD